MPVLIQINGETADEAIRELSTLASGITGQAGTTAPAAAEAPKQPRTRKTESVKETPAAAAEPEEDPKNAEPEQEDESTGGAEPDEDSGSDEPIPTDVDLRAVASAVGVKGADAKKAIKALLDKYGVPNITAVPQDKRIAFKAELEAI
ncbi:hypothetical protein COLU111180_06370 [Cohnella lubricantis]|uniref:Uncharacterized protein n=1 Tax=Cohnella lubricantis TaxID=2163172 RepID=A0A841TBK7_9BACL|nr:hypothetical protein [Cohnella lubricantis]MBB6677496.1 hypothetical protein [Cohnella lubricantis]MBP2116618.1 putative membrane protein [Cohnella lubricantis]